MDPEKTEALPQDITARKDLVGYDPQPVTDLAHEHLGIAFMSTDVVSRDIGQYALVAIALLLKDEALLVPKARGSVVPAPQIEPELERHVEARLVSWTEGLDPGDVVNAITARANEVADLVDPDMARVGLVRCEPRLETTLEDDEDQRMKEWDVLSVKRTVDEETALEAIEAPHHRSRWANLTARSFQRSEEEAGSPKIQALRPKYGSQGPSVGGGRALAHRRQPLPWS